MSMAWVFQGGKKNIAVTSVTLVNNTALVTDVTVGTGKRWLLISVKITNPDSVTRNCYIIHYKESAKTNLVTRLADATNLASGATFHVPSFQSTTSQTSAKMPFIMDAGETLSILWEAGGASAGGVDADGLVVEYMEIDL